MPVRNRRARLLVLAVFVILSLILYSRTATTLEDAKRIAEQTYYKTVASTALKNTPSNPDTAKSGSAKDHDPIAPAQPKKEDIVQADYAAIAKGANTLVAEMTATAAVNPLKTDVIANPNPMVGVAGLKTDAAAFPAPKTTTKAGGDSKDKQALAPLAAPPATFDDQFPVRFGEGRVEVDVEAPNPGKVLHWSKQPENYPVSSTKQLPTAAASTIPKIQHAFKRSGDFSGADMQKLLAIKGATVHAWNGYREKAMGHDEIKPISGKYANPFNAWGATLVDSLDTLWMMGMATEFQEALDHVKNIDFTTSPRPDIPLFETTIRYLGGLLGAYEISGRNYKILLDKSVELAEILYGAFDTPNRMPITYYQWKPAFASNPHRASTRAIMSELGSLSLEFTRLAELTSEPKYYDAIARITDAFDEWQKSTRIPGLWPTTLDASGCKKPAQASGEKQEKAKSTTDKDTSGSVKTASGQSAKGDADLPGVASGDVNPNTVNPPGADGLAGAGGVSVGMTKEPVAAKVQGLGGSLNDESTLGTKAAKDQPSNKKAGSGVAYMVKRALTAVGAAKADSPSLPESSALSSSAPSNPAPRKDESKADSRPLLQAALTGSEVCLPQGLASSSERGSDFFTLGAAADSTYEYLPKMHLMLSGREEQYKKMYLKAADASIEWLIYRPMIPDEKRDILFAGTVDTKPNVSAPGEMIKDFKPIGTHLTCFAGGMFALAGKIFKRPEDVEIGRKLTDGCVWAYNVTTTGIMPEVMGLMKCEDQTKCRWNETAYWHELDPWEESRTMVVPTSSQQTSTAAPAVPALAAATPAVAAAAPLQSKAALAKRQFGDEMRYADKTTPVYPTEPTSVKPDAAGMPAGAGMPALHAPAANSPAANAPLLNAPAAASAPAAVVAAANAPPLNPIAVNSPPIKSGASNAPPSSPGVNAPPLAGNAAPNVPVLPLLQEAAALATTMEFAAPPPLTHEEYVKKKIEDERLPPGFTDVYDKRFLLRPEAIESVFYMYRITGEQYWRDRGWEMWEHIWKHTYAQFGASAIDDVTKNAPEAKVCPLLPVKSWADDF